jgi:hypothetical protein
MTNFTHDVDGPDKISASADFEAVLNNLNELIKVEDYTVAGY